MQRAIELLEKAIEYAFTHKHTCGIWQSSPCSCKLIETRLEIKAYLNERISNAQQGDQNPKIT